MIFKSKSGAVVISGKAGNVKETRVVGQKQTKIKNFSVMYEKDEEGNGKFMSVNAWAELANVVENIQKGDSVFVAGRIVKRSYTNRDGEEVHAEDINAEWLSVASSRGSHCEVSRSTNGANVANTGSQEARFKDSIFEAVEEFEDDDLPF